MHHLLKVTNHFILLIAFFGALLHFAQPSGAQTLSCANGDPIVQNFASGAKWEMCWAHQPNEGIVLSDAYYTSVSGTRRKVLALAAIGQIFAAFDDNSTRLHQVSDAGLGGNNLGALVSAECSGTLHQHDNKNVLCSQQLDRGYLYKFHHLQKQASKLQLHSVSFISEQAYIVQWSFFDDGTIEPAIGYSGQLERITSDSRHGWAVDANDGIGIGQIVTAYWRLDFDLGANGANDLVEELAATPANLRYRKELSVTPILTETGRTLNPDTKRSWRVRDALLTNADGHAISYHLEPINAANNHIGPVDEPWTVHDIYFTVDNDCERFVSHNPVTNGCADNVSTFVNGEGLNSADVVLWYGITYRHLPRDEDELYRNVHWDSFQLVPRDWTAVSEIAQ